MVGVVGFEPTTPCSQSRCANRTALHPDGEGEDKPAGPDPGITGRQPENPSSFPRNHVTLNRCPAIEAGGPANHPPAGRGRYWLISSLRAEAALRAAEAKSSPAEA